MVDLPDYYTQAQISEAEAASFKGGLDANKSATPVSRDIYFATDTRILYICVEDGTWTGFDASILTQGILTLYANLAGGGFEIKNIADPTAAQDAATQAYVLAQVALRLALAGGTMSGNIDMGGNSLLKLLNLYGTDDYDLTILANATTTASTERDILFGALNAAANVYLTVFKVVANGASPYLKMEKILDANSQRIRNLTAPVYDNDAARKKYVDDLHALCLLLAGGTMSGNIAMATNKVTGLGAPTNSGDAARKDETDLLTPLATFNTHKDRHDPNNGADPLDTDVASDQSFGDTATEGTAHSFARSDHKHGMPANPAKSIATGSYTGDGSDDRQITVGFQCSLIVLRDTVPYRMFICIDTAAAWELEVNANTIDAVSSLLLHATNGFVVDANYANVDGRTYNYWAISV